MSRYISERRKLQTQRTQRDIVLAARRKFAANGYSRTSMEEIAREAGVAVQTIYSSVGSKRELLRRMNDLVDEEGGVAEIEEQMAHTEDPHQLLTLCVRLTRQVAERCGDIIATVNSAAIAEGEMAEILAEGVHRHQEGTRRVAEALAQAGALRHGVSAERGAQLLAVLTYNGVYFQLTRDYGMSFSDAEDWVLSTLEALVLAPRGG